MKLTLCAGCTLRGSDPASPAAHDRTEVLLAPGELLRKVLLLERSGGFRDRAVIGGLEGFATRTAPGPAAQVLRGYGLLAPPEREPRIAQALAAHVTSVRNHPSGCSRSRRRVK